MNFSPGDMVYYPAHYALGLLLSRRESDAGVEWHYVLRSPRSLEDLSKVITSYRSVSYDMLLDGVQTGRLKYIKTKPR